MDTIPGAVIVIDDLETLRIVCDPLRLKIFRTVSEINLTGSFCAVKQISDELEIPPAKLYYHIKLLETHGLLQVAETRIVSGILEKLYQVHAHRITISNELFGTGENSETLFPIFAGLITEVLNDIQGILTKPQKGMDQNNLAISRLRIQLPRNRITEFSQKMEDSLREIEAQEGEKPGEDTSVFTYFYAFYPAEKAAKAEYKNSPHGTMETGVSEPQQDVT